jgi:ATP-dependent helicase/nuclease subunit B
VQRLITSLRAQDRLGPCEEFLQRAGRTEVLVVSATRMAADELVRAHTLKSGGSFGIHRFSLASLAVEIASERLAAAGKALLAGVAVDALAARAVQNCRAEASLKWFEPVAGTTGFFRALASTITELRANAVDLERLRPSGPAGSDLAALLISFERYLDESGLADLAQVYRTATQAVRDGGYRFQGFPLLLLDVSPRSCLERQFIQQLAMSLKPVLAVSNVRDERIPLDVEPEVIHEQGSNALARLRRHVFSMTAAPDGELDSSLQFRSATDEARECVEMARSVMEHAQNGMLFDRIAILLRNPEAYQALVEDALKRAGIPAFFTQGTRRPNPSGRAFLALLACAAEGLSASRFSEYLSLGQVPEPDDKGEPPRRDPAWVPVQGELFPDIRPEKQTTPRPAPGPERPVKPLRTPQHWERLLVDAAVIGGLDRWIRRLDGLEHELQTQIQELRREDEARLAHRERQLERLRDLRKFALPIIEFLDRLPQNAVWGDWLDALERLAAMAIRQPEVVLATVAELRPMSNVGPVSLEEVREVLMHRLTFLRTEPTERRYGKVLVATIPEAAGLAFDTVFLPGLGEDLFPKRVFEDPLLLDADRKSVSADLPVQDRRVAEERLLLHLAAGAAHDRLCISYPRMNVGQGRARGPSFYAIEVIRAVTGRIPDLQELQRAAFEASQSQPGWPSPRNPDDAIDDAEYDLAVIRKLMRAPATERRGAARYLFSANKTLERSLQTRWYRWSSRWSDADGVVDPDQATRDRLSQHSLKKRPYSATSLQHFAACPYRFLLHAIHRLEPRQEAVALERMDPLTRGRLIHEIQFQILTSGDFENTDRLFDETVARYRDLVAPAIPRVWEDEIETIRWDIRGWLRYLRDGGGWTPKWFELPFALTLAEGSIVRGAIDMVEEKDGQLRITDHKTGKAQPAFGFTRNGELLQPLLYVEAAESLLGKPAAFTRLFYCTHRGGYKIDEIPVTDEGRRHFSNVMQRIDESLAQGFLPAAPRKDACKYCDYQIVCGPYEEIRIQRKKTDRLRLLEQLRAIP